MKIWYYRIALIVFLFIYIFIYIDITGQTMRTIALIFHNTVDIYNINFKIDIYT